VNLQRHGIRASAYHAGMPGRSREKVQDDFLRDRVKVIVATIAFGMGVDKPNVRFVIHHDLPKSMESYYQETGRAGRDGLESEAMLLYGSGDVNLVRRLIENVENPEQRRVEVHKLNSMISLAESLTCRRKVLLGYFNEYLEDDCGNCDVCLDPPEKYDARKQAKMVADTIQELDGDYAVGYIVDVLRGSKSKRILEKNHETLACHGIGKDINADEWTSIVRQLVHRGFYSQDISKRAAVVPTDKSEVLLSGKKSVILAKYQPGIKRKLRRFSVVRDNSLFNKLVELRSELAQKEDAAPHTLFSDVTLTELSQLGNIDKVENPFELVSGMGTHKIEAYGEAFLEVIRSHVGKKSSAKSMDDSKPILLAKGPSATDSQVYTWNLYKSGKSVEEIAAEQGVSEKTIINHFIALVRAAHYIEVRDIIGERFDDAMTELRDADPYASLSEIKQELSVDLTNEEFRLILAWREGIGVS